MVVVVVKAYDRKSQFLDLLGELAAKSCLTADQRRSCRDCQMITLNVLCVPEICDQVADVPGNLLEDMSVDRLLWETYTGAVGLFR